MIKKNLNSKISIMTIKYNKLITEIDFIHKIINLNNNNNLIL